MFASPPTEPLDIRHLPALVPSSHANSTSHAILHELSTRIDKMQSLIKTHKAPATELVDSQPANCSFILWLQMTPLQGVSQEEIDEYEKEQAVSTGRSVKELPKPSVKGYAYSSNCGLALELKQTEGTFLSTEN